MAGPEIGIWKQSGFPGGKSPSFACECPLPSRLQGGEGDGSGEPPGLGEVGRKAVPGVCPGRAFSLLPSFCAVEFLYSEVWPFSPCSVGLFPLSAAAQVGTAGSSPTLLHSRGSDGSSLTLPADRQFSPPVKTERVLDQAFS